MRLLIQNAYDLVPFQITGGPDWTKSDLYEIDAKAESNATKNETLLMLQSLLEDRFQLKFHRETKEVPAYNLVAAKSGFKLPSPKQASCEGSDPTIALVAQCGRILIQRDIHNGVIEDSLHGGLVVMAELSKALSRILGRPVIDKTGFINAFDIDMSFTPDQATAGIPARPASAEPDPSAPTISVALQEKLGLRLESSKGPLEILIIDHVEKPAAN